MTTRRDTSGSVRFGLDLDRAELVVTFCRSCQAPIVWARTEKGKRAPIDATPDPDGTIVLRLREDDAEPLAIFGVPADAFEDEPRWTSHFATCPDASGWRR